MKPLNQRPALKIADSSEFGLTDSQLRNLGKDIEKGYAKFLAKRGLKRPNNRMLCF